MTSRVASAAQMSGHTGTRVAGVAVILLAAEWLALGPARGPGEPPSIWISNGVAVGWLLTLGRRYWTTGLLLVACIDLTAHLLTALPLGRSLVVVAANVLEVLTIAGTIRKLVPDSDDPRGWVYLGSVATASTLLGCAVAGVLATAVGTASFGLEFGPTFLGWFAAHVVGVVVFATATYVTLRRGFSFVLHAGQRRAYALSLSLVAAVSILVFCTERPILFLAYPALLLAAFRHRFMGVVGGVSILTVVASVATVSGWGPFSTGSGLGEAARLALLQLYLAGACLMTYPVALAVTERRRLVSEIKERELRYRLLAEYSHDVIVQVRASGDRVYVSPSSREVLGWSPEEMLGSRWSLIHPDDRAVQTGTMAEVLATGESKTTRYRVRHRRGHYIWVEAVAKPIPNADVPGAFDVVIAGRDVTARVEAENELIQSKAELELLARVDALTGLANRRQFEERLALALERLKRQRLPIALIFLDVDHFKSVNDEHGHSAGDAVLKSVSARLKACTRKSDLVARFGGDEFVVLIEDLGLPATASAIGEKLLTCTSAPVELEEGLLSIGISMGIACAEAPTTAQVLIERADGALYDAKRAGRGTLRVASTNTEQNDEVG